MEERRRREDEEEQAVGSEEKVLMNERSFAVEQQGIRMSRERGKGD